MVRVPMEQAHNCGFAHSIRPFSTRQRRSGDFAVHFL